MANGPAKAFFGADLVDRSVWVVVDPRDFVTGTRVTAPLRVRLKDITAAPIAARSHVYCFTDLNLPAANYTVQVSPTTASRNLYLDAERQFTLNPVPLPGQPLQRNPVVVQMMPRPSYQFEALATLARGRLIKASDSSPIPDAQIFLILDAVEKGLRGQSDERGEFAVFFPPAAPGDDPAAVLKDFKFRLRFEIPNHAPLLTAEQTVKEGSTKSMEEITFPGT
jgi:hypothetical protein